MHNTALTINAFFFRFFVFFRSAELPKWLKISPINPLNFSKRYSFKRFIIFIIFKVL